MPRRQRDDESPEEIAEHDAHLDPLTQEPGSHPLGTAAGSAAGAAAGAALGSAAGPAGTVVGGTIGAIAGGIAGHKVAENVNPTAEEGYWRETYTSRPYVNREYTFDDYGPAYRYGWEARTRWADRQFDEVEPQLGRDWSDARGESRLEWGDAKVAARDAWDRITERRDDRLP
jgi:hypothetical protein